MKYFDFAFEIIWYTLKVCLCLALVGFLVNFGKLSVEVSLLFTILLLCLGIRYKG
ncbi:MAG: hypothetical protein ACRCZO_18950 [Cetobacterium sp.]